MRLITDDSLTQKFTSYLEGGTQTAAPTNLPLTEEETINTQNLSMGTTTATPLPQPPKTPLQIVLAVIVGVLFLMNAYAAYKIVKSKKV